jgi:hypothetical protein
MGLDNHNQLEQNIQQPPNVVTMSKNHLEAQVSDNIDGSQIFDSGVEIQSKPDAVFEGKYQPLNRTRSDSSTLNAGRSLF